MPQRGGQHGDLRARTLPIWGALQSPYEGEEGPAHPPTSLSVEASFILSVWKEREGMLMFVVGFGGAWRVVVLEKEQFLGGVER